jgi:hypothetical protein
MQENSWCWRVRRKCMEGALTVQLVVRWDPCGAFDGATICMRRRDRRWQLEKNAVAIVACQLRVVRHHGVGTFHRNHKLGVAKLELQVGSLQVVVSLLCANQLVLQAGDGLEDCIEPSTLLLELPDLVLDLPVLLVHFVREQRVPQLIS